MSTYQDSILVDSCQYTPIYLVQDSGAIEGHPYIIAQENAEEVKSEGPVTDNLKIFYENCGIFESSDSGNNTLFISKPTIEQKKNSKLKENNLKMATFLKHKTSNSICENNLSKQSLPVNNVVIKPSTVSTNVVNTVPKVQVDRKIVKLEDFPSALKRPPREKILPKKKPKKNQPIKHTTLQLLKLGETYHSLNQLSDDQMKMVNQALNIFNNPEKVATLEPTYDPVTKTRFIYKVVSPKDLTVVGKNKLGISTKKGEGMKEMRKEKPKPDILSTIKKWVEDSQVKQEPPEEGIKVTRSGRKVKFPKQIVPDNTPHNKPKKKTGAVVSCFECSTEFCSLYRLQKHYENHPTHVPAKVHSNLFHCLLAIIKSGSEDDRSNIFIQQLEQLIEKLRSLLPCLLKKVDGRKRKSCTINEDIGRLFGMNPGKYNLNVDALTCVKDKDGNCRHNPPKASLKKSDPTKHSAIWLNKQNEDMKLDKDTEDCERIYTVDKWPTAHKRLCNSKQQISQQSNAKRIRLNSESTEPLIELGMEDLDNLNHDQSAINVQPKSLSMLDDLVVEVANANSIQQVKLDDAQSNEATVDPPVKCIGGAPTRFHSSHFDIRSSPIKPSAAVFRKFQINPNKLPTYDVQIMRPMDLDSKKVEISEESSIPSIPCDTVAPELQNSCDTVTPDLQSIFRDDLAIKLSPCKNSNGIPPELTFDDSKDWIIETGNDKSIDSFIKTNSELNSSLLHVQDNSIDNIQIENLIDTNDQLGDSRVLSSRSSSVLNFLESLGNECLSYPETAIRNNSVENVDFQLDLFSFSNT